MRLPAARSMAMVSRPFRVNLCPHQHFQRVPHLVALRTGEVMHRPFMSTRPSGLTPRTPAPESTEGEPFGTGAFRPGPRQSLAGSPTTACGLFLFLAEIAVEINSNR
jgi:hypothetical protein